MKEKPKNKNVAIYSRVSSTRQATVLDGSLDTQEDRIRKAIEIRAFGDEQWTVHDVYREEGRSGKNLDRPEFQRMIEDLKTGHIDVIYVTKIDRITRSLKDFYDLWEMFQDYGVEFVSLNEQFDTTNPMGRFALKQILLFAELEREITGERTKEKMQWRAEQGFWNGGKPPPGYKFDPENKGILQINKDEADLVKTIFTSYLKNKSADKTRDWLNENGYRTPVYHSKSGKKHGGNTFGKQSLINILTNPVYIGKVKNKENVYDGKHEPLISEKEFNQVQAILNENRDTRRNPDRIGDHVYILKGLIRCGKCGAAMVPASANGRKGTYFYYQCTRRSHKGKSQCDQAMLPAETVEEGVLEWVRMITLKQDEIEKIILKANESTDATLKETTTNISMMNKRLKVFIDERRGYLDTVKNLGIPGARAVRDDLDRVQLEIEDLEVKLERSMFEESQLQQKTLRVDTVINTLKHFSQIIEGATPKELKRILPTVIKGIEIQEDQKTGEGVLEVYLWEEVQEAIESNLFKNNKKDEPDVNQVRPVSRMAPRVGLEPTT